MALEMTMLKEQKDLFGEIVATKRYPRTQYLGSKERLVEWIFDKAPKNIETVLDAFSGTSVVGYYFKGKGKRVIGNDFLKFNYHIGKAMIENKKEILSNEDLDMLFSFNKKAKSLIEDVFTGVFFEKSDAKFLDNFRANIDFLDNDFKKSLALAIMCRSLTRKILLGHFAHTSALRYSKDKDRIKRNPSIAKPIKDLFLQLYNSYNEAVFDNRMNNKFYCEDTIKLTKRIKNVDLVYFDPPYCGCHPDYQAFYHFLETFVEYWDDKEFINGTKQYFPKKESGFVQKKDVVNSFDELFKASKHIPHWLISYNSKSYPDKDTMVSLIKKYKKVKVYEYKYKNHYGGKGSRRGTSEYLFYCYNK